MLKVKEAYTGRRSACWRRERGQASQNSKAAAPCQTLTPRKNSPFSQAGVP
jgi:hypothetical protein